MSQDSLHIVITIGIIALMFAWVPLLGFICPPGWSSRDTSKEQEKSELESGQNTVRHDVSDLITLPPAAPSASRSSKRIADKSRDLLQAMSGRGDRSISRVPSGTPYTS